jgi:hypothetical protein
MTSNHEVGTKKNHRVAHFPEQPKNRPQFTFVPLAQLLKRVDEGLTLLHPKYLQLLDKPIARFSNSG